MTGKHTPPNQTAQLDWLSETVEPPEKAQADVSGTANTVSAGFPERMVLLDCETTGLKPTVCRMIEVALLVIEQGQIIEQWSTLINPSTHIPPEIRRITGITPDHLAGAPDFKSIADELLERLEGRVLVAHNARFDYGFLKNEFSRAGIQYNTKPLCSVKISRKLFPQYRQHGLSEIIKRFNFSIDNRHRALDDTLMIWKFFLQVSSQISEEKIRTACDQLLERPSLPIHLDSAEIDKLPNTPGVYYFYDTHDKLLYIGKSVNIRTRVMSHFTQDHRNNKDLEMSTQIAHVDFETTPSDFGAQLYESQQVKALNPYYNRRLRKAMKLYQYQTDVDASGYLHIRTCTLKQVVDTEAEQQQSGLFRSRNQAEGQLEKLAEHFFLCQKLCGLEGNQHIHDGKPCFGYQLKRCMGACCHEESTEAYNERVGIALSSYQRKKWLWPSAILVEEKSAQPESTESPSHWHLFHHWRYLTQIRSPDELYDQGYQPLATVPDRAAAVDADNNTDNEPVDFDPDIYQILVRFLLNLESRKFSLGQLQKNQPKSA